MAKQKREAIEKKAKKNGNPQINLSQHYHEEFGYEIEHDSNQEED